MGIPESFQRAMREQWTYAGSPGLIEDFFAALSEAPFSAIRANGLKITRAELAELLGDVVLGPVPWTDDGLYIQADFKASASLWYKAGLFYIQDPSAMLPASVLGVQAGERVLDMCAAPGGKTIRLAADCGSFGQLYANEKSEKRARALLRNLELAGAAAAVVTVCDATALPKSYEKSFDAVLLDSPCSGSGMFRKDAHAAEAYELFGPQTVCALQASLLEAADRVLKPGGRLLYSTCSFNYEEDEGQILAFLERHPNYRVLPIHAEGLSPGLLKPGMLADIQNCARIWPHMTLGEGHFCALLYKFPDESISEGGSRNHERAPRSDLELQLAEQALAEFARSNWHMKKAWPESTRLRLKDEQLFLLEAHTKVEPHILYYKTGLHLGTVKRLKRMKKSVFTPSHAACLALDPSLWRYQLAVSEEEGEALCKGLTHPLPQECADLPSGAYVLATYGSYPLLLLQRQGNILKNHYPLGWVAT